MSVGCTRNAAMFCPVHGEVCPDTWEPTDEEREELLAWRRRVERLAADDPDEYLRACRAGEL